ncbi:CoA-disulfide reductase [Falsibacillus pallidus]|uniref:NADPH-dependent 2,4-dienoyl-CoA reductase/sulfur reductase-like enzyme n=1 Tax=Falsibacillus pallidus TaxID=493781 RepID=A0A370GVU9_9BACI|nr:CoA-disulfide reductase [Falsibacillus pallidus]RDI47798.1 NADPH-dependent 2,4-dienoyl-CoA reductase/sulfur reductase-like enzyme [Falsibacillus pallidus]
MPKHIVIVGGVAGGATVAAQLRRLNKDIRISIFEKGGQIAYSNCGIPYYIGGIVPDRNSILRDCQDFSDKYDAAIHLYTEVTSIDREKQRISFIDLKDNKEGYEEYDHLILSPGASARIPDIPNLNAGNCFPIRSIQDMDHVHQFIEESSPKTALIAGGGFIGVEMAENLILRGLNVQLLERSKQVMGILDSDMAELMEKEMRDKGISLLFDEELAAVEDGGTTFVMKSGKRTEADLLILSMGIIPNTSLAEQSGLKIGETKGIVANEFMQTNDPLIYVLGDAAETVDPILHKPKQVPLAWPAHRQAYIIANHIAGVPIPYKGTYGTAIVKFFDLAAGMIGHNEKTLKSMETPFKTEVVEAKSHAGYFPGSMPLKIKLHYDPVSRAILGAQTIGKDGADKRIDVIAAAMKGKLTVDDLQEIELAYAPPFSSPKDPVNILGYMASSKNINKE